MSKEKTVIQSAISTIFSVRFAIYVAGFIVLGLGIVLNTKTMLGVSPVISVPYCINHLLDGKLGVTTFIYYCLMVLAQFLILRKAFPKHQWLQMIMSFVNSASIQIFDDMIPVIEGTAARIIILIIAVIITAVGVSMIVGMRFVPNAADGFADVLGRVVLKKDMGFGKNVLDICSICVSVTLGLITTGSLLGIGLGTVVAAILTGRVVAITIKPVNRLYEKLEAEKNK